MLVKVNSKLSLHSSIDRCSCARMSIWSWSASSGPLPFRWEWRKSGNLSNKLPSISGKSDWILFWPITSFVYTCVCRLVGKIQKLETLWLSADENRAYVTPFATIFAGKADHYLWFLSFLQKHRICFDFIYKKSLKANKLSIKTYPVITYIGMA